MSHVHMMHGRDTQLPDTMHGSQAQFQVVVSDSGCATHIQGYVTVTGRLLAGSGLHIYDASKSVLMGFQ